MARRGSISRPLAVALVLAVLASFAPILANDFVNWDDDLVLTANDAYRGFSAAHLRWMATTTLGGHWQPLTWLTYAADHALWGMDPRGYHLTSLVLHALNALLVWRVLALLLAIAGAEATAFLDQAPPAAGPAPRAPAAAADAGAAAPDDPAPHAGAASAPWAMTVAAAAGALFFAVHPLRVESVAWATERRDVLSGCFWLLALLAYLRATTGRSARVPGLALAAATLALSLGAKAWGMTLPLVLLVLDAYPLGRWSRAPRRVLLEKAPFAVLATAAGAIAFLAQRGVPEMRTMAEHGVGARLAQAAWGLCSYLVTTVAPIGLHPAYLLEPDLDPTSPGYLGAMAAVLALTGAALGLRRRAPWFLAAWTAYILILAPVLGLAQTGPQRTADRYTYLAMLPWTAVLAAGLARLLSPGVRARTRRTACAATAAALGVLAALTVRQTRVWRDSVTLWSHVLAVDPSNWVAYTNRGFAREPRDPEAAIADYDAAIARNPRFPLAYFNRGNARHARGDYAGAVADHSLVIALLPDDPRGHNNRGWARQALGDWEGAARDYERALALAAPDWWARELVAGNLANARARITANLR